MQLEPHGGGVVLMSLLAAVQAFSRWLQTLGSGTRATHRLTSPITWLSPPPAGRAVVDRDRVVSDMNAEKEKVLRSLGDQAIGRRDQMSCRFTNAGVAIDTQRRGLSRKEQGVHQPPTGLVTVIYLKSHVLGVTASKSSQRTTFPMRA